MTVYRPETYEADTVLAVRDLLGHAWSVADEDLARGESYNGGVLADLLGEAEAAVERLDADTAAGGPDDPVRSVRAAIELLYLADADGPGEGWGDVAEELGRRLWARGEPADNDHDDSGRGGDCADVSTYCGCVGVASDGTPYGCVREPGHAEHHLSPDGWRWESRGPWRDSPPDFVPEAIVLGRDGSHDKEIPW